MYQGRIQPVDATSWAGQQWIPQANGSILNPGSGRCLDLPAGNLTPGTDLKIWDCNGLWPQQWKVAV